MNQSLKRDSINFMLTRKHQRLKDFDALTFEEERYRIFQETEQTYQATEVSSAVLSSTPAPLSDSALDANWDAVLGFEPTPEQWHDPDYRRAYLDGIAQKYDRPSGKAGGRGQKAGG